MAGTTMTMDELDTKILEVILRDGGPSNARIADDLGVSESTVRRRRNRLARELFGEPESLPTKATEDQSAHDLNAVPLIIDPEAEPHLVGDMVKLSEGLISLLRKQIELEKVNAEKIVVDLKYSPEDDWEEVVFRVYVKEDDDRAMAFWEAIGDAITEWRKRLPAKFQKMLDEVGAFVEWM